MQKESESRDLVLLDRRNIYIILQVCIIGFTLFVWFVSVSEKKIPHGLIEWALTVLSVIILISWAIKH